MHGIEHAATARLLVPYGRIELAVGDVFAGLLNSRAGPQIRRRQAFVVIAEAVVFFAV